MDTPTDHLWTVLRFDAEMMANKSGWSFIESVLRNKLESDPSRRFIVVTDTVNDIYTPIRLSLRRAIHGEDVALDTVNDVHHRLHQLAAQLDLPFPTSPAQLAAAISNQDSPHTGEYNLPTSLNHRDAIHSLHDLLSVLRQTLTALSLLGESTPRAEARTLSVSSRLSARLGAWYLGMAADLPAVYMDPRRVLRTAPATGRDSTSDHTEHDAYLQADAHSPFFDPEAEEQLWDTNGRIVVIPGGVGGNDDEHATLLAGNNMTVHTANNGNNEGDGDGINTMPGMCCHSGGSDVSAAVLAGKVGAHEVEIFTSSAGLYTYVPVYYELPSDPEVLASARLLRNLSYAEGQEIAATSLSVLHPTAITMLQEHDIPLRIRSRQIYASGSNECTLISSRDDPPSTGKNKSLGGGGDHPRVKAICRRNGVVVVSIDSLVMWQQVGFLSTLFDLFRRHHISVDCITTSEANVTVTLDQTSPSLAPLLHDIRANCHCTASTVGPCAAISLVGQEIRSVLHSLGPALRVFEDHNIYLLSHAASDVNLTFLVDEDTAPRILQRLHECFFSHAAPDSFLGPSYYQLVGSSSSSSSSSSPIPPSSSSSSPSTVGDSPSPTDHNHAVISSPTSPWWSHSSIRHQLINLIHRDPHRSPVFVYHESTLRSRASAIQRLPVDRVLYAVKANPNPAVLRLVVAAGLGMECVSIEEVRHVRQHVPNLSPDRILFTPNFVDAHEYAAAFEIGVQVTVDNVFPLSEWGGTVFRGREVLLRIDPGTGLGHHHKVQTAGDTSKFGIPVPRLEETAALCREHDVRVVGLHAHVGSGIVDRPGAWARTGRLLMDVRSRLFPEVRYLDLGGGFGVPERVKECYPNNNDDDDDDGDGDDNNGNDDEDIPVLDLSQVGRELQQFRDAHPQLQDGTVSLWIEPGRYVVAEAGVLLTTVTQTKSKGKRVYVGVNTGMNTLLRPALYGAYHAVANLSRWREPRVWTADVVGPICESGDVLGAGRMLPECRNGDVMVVGTAGAYGRSMSSWYNLRDPAREIMMEKEEEKEHPNPSQCWSHPMTDYRFVNI